MKFSDYCRNNALNANNANNALNEASQENNSAKKYADIVLEDAKDIIDVLNKIEDDETVYYFCRNMIYHLSRTSSLLRDYVKEYGDNTDSKFIKAVKRNIGRISKELSALDDVKDDIN